MYFNREGRVKVLRLFIHISDVRFVMTKCSRKRFAIERGFGNLNLRSQLSIRSENEEKKETRPGIFHATRPWCAEERIRGLDYELHATETIISRNILGERRYTRALSIRFGNGEPSFQKVEKSKNSFGDESQFLIDWGWEGNVWETTHRLSHGERWFVDRRRLND